MATEFEFDNLPTDEMAFMDALPDEFYADAQAAFNEAIASGLVVAREAKVAHLYERKQVIAVDDFGGKRNESYGSDTDDVVIQLTLRVSHPETVRGNALRPLAALEERVRGHKVAAERARLEAEIAAEDEKAAKAAETAKKKREQLEALRNQ